jgi:molybdopterin molybdotransferase
MKHFIPFDLAIKSCLKTITNIKKFSTSVQNSYSYILAKNYKSKIDLPKFNTSAKDGFAIKSSCTKNVSKKNPVYLKIVGKISAGEPVKNFNIKNNSCVKIMTGAIVPKNFYAVIHKESVIEENGYIKIFYTIKKFFNLRKKSLQLKKNQLLLKKGTLIRPQEVGLLISAGFSKILVYKKPTIAIITTGNEVVEINKKPNDFQIKDVNSYVLKTLLQKYNFKYINYGLVKDNFFKLKNVISKAITNCDVVLISGGISYGEHDFVKPVLKNLGVKPIFWELRCRPAKPLFFGTKIVNHKKKFVFGIPGNPVSNFVIFEVLIKNFLYTLSGNKNFNSKIFTAILTKNVKKEFEFKYFLRGNYIFKNNKFYVTPLENQDSSVLKSLTKANCLIILDEQYIEIKKGNIVKIQLLD